MINSSDAMKSLVRGVVGIAVAFVAVGSVRAQTQYYDFKFSRGGGGAGDPARTVLVQSAGTQICLAVSPAPNNRVRFMLWALFPEPKARIPYVMIDTGRHVDLLTDVSVLVMSPGLKMAASGPQALASLPTITPDFQFGIHGSGPAEVAHALGPKQSLIISAALGRGKTFNDVRSALNEGISPATATRGLRFAVIAWFLAGGPPPGVASIHDDGGFIVSSMSSRCGQQ